MQYLTPISISTAAENVREDIYRLYIDYHSLKANYWRQHSPVTVSHAVQDITSLINLTHTDIREQNVNYITASLLSQKITPHGHCFPSDIVMLLINWMYFGNSSMSSRAIVTTLAVMRLDDLDAEISSMERIGVFARLRMFTEVSIMSQPRLKTERRFQQHFLRHANLSDAIFLSNTLCQIYMEDESNEELATEVDRAIRLGMAFVRDYPLSPEQRSSIVGSTMFFKGLVLQRLGRFKESRYCLEHAVELLKAVPSPATEWMFNRALSCLAAIDRAETGRVNPSQKWLERSLTEQDKVRKDFEALGPILFRARQTAMGLDNDERVLGNLVRAHSNLAPGSQEPYSAQNWDLATKASQAFFNFCADRAQNEKRLQINRQAQLASLQTFFETENVLGQSQIFHMLAIEAFEQGRMEDSLEHYMNLYNTFFVREGETQHSTSAILSLNMAGVCAAQLNDFSTAFLLFQRSLACTAAWAMNPSQKRVVLSTLEGLVGIARRLEVKEIDLVPFTTQLLALAYDPTINLAPEYRTLGHDQKVQADEWMANLKMGFEFYSIWSAKMIEIQAYMIHTGAVQAPDGSAHTESSSSSVHEVATTAAEEKEQDATVENGRLLCVCPTMEKMLGIPFRDLEFFFLHFYDVQAKLYVQQENPRSASGGESDVNMEEQLDLLREAQWILFSDRKEKRALKFLDPKWKKKVSFSASRVDFGDYRLSSPKSLWVSTLDSYQVAIVQGYRS